MNADNEKVRALPMRWRHNAQGCGRRDAHAAATWRSCARELEAALATPPKSAQEGRERLDGIARRLGVMKQDVIRFLFLNNIMATVSTELDADTVRDIENHFSTDSPPESAQDAHCQKCGFTLSGLDHCVNCDASPEPPAAAEAAARRICKWWQQDEGYEVFSTSCGHEYQVNDCTDGNVQLPFCPFCSRNVEGHAWVPDDDMKPAEEVATEPAAQEGDRDAGGRIVREAWIAWAREQPNPKPSWLVPYDELSEPDKEADRRIYEACRAQPVGEVDESIRKFVRDARSWLDSRAENARPGWMVAQLPVVEAALNAARLPGAGGGEAGEVKSPSYDALLLIAQSVCGALERAGLTDCDDPGEAIDVIRERLERRIAELEAASFDAEAVAWAYGKLRDFGCYASEAGAQWGDRLNLMLMQAAATNEQVKP